LRVEAGTTYYQTRRNQKARARMVKRSAVAGALLVAAFLIVIGIVYAGSPGTIAKGIRVAGVDVGGLSPRAAQRLLEAHAATVQGTPLTLTAGNRTFRLTAARLGVQPDWAAAAAAARRKGDGLGPLRGFRRIDVRLFGANITAPARVDDALLEAQIGRISKALDRPAREPAIVLHGLRAALVPGKTGRVLDREATKRLIVARVASLSREPIALPFSNQPPAVLAAELVPVAARARLALSAPVRLALGPTRYIVPRWQIAGLLELPANGSRTLKLGGPGADKYFATLERAVNRPARDAHFVVIVGGIHIVPSVDARVVDVPATSRNLLAAALSPANRVAQVVVGSKPANRTTKDAEAMGIVGTVSTYTTIFGGIANRIHNVQLVAHLIDDHLIRPGEEFSFNKTTGDRNAAKGFLQAPVIINGELKTALGGGVCQVSTTTFNAAYEAGLKITARTNHALYISHYPQGRDATVNYPDTDLRFVNDTGHWLLLRTFVSSDSLTVNLYGTPTRRKVVSTTGPLKVTGPAPVKKEPDPTLLKGKKVVDPLNPGSPSLSTWVHRLVYSPSGKLLHDDTWYSSYRGETQILHVGTKPKPKLGTILPTLTKAPF
jgi:vancomycin resistance protein YoaR